MMKYDIDEYREAVGCIVWDEDWDRILLVRRSPKETSCIGLWEVPGGKVEDYEGEPDDYLKDTADTELSEETGMVLPDWDYGDVHVDHDMMKIYSTIHYYQEKNQNPVLSEEHDAYVWITPEEIMNQHDNGQLWVSHHLLHFISKDSLQPGWGQMQLRLQDRTRN